MNTKINMVALSLLLSVNLHADGFFDFLNSKKHDAKAHLTCVKMEILSSSLQLFRLDNLLYPSKEEGLKALVMNPDSKKYTQYANNAYLKELPLDAWNSEFIYNNKDEKFEIISYGADKKEGGEGKNEDIYFSNCKTK